MFNTSFASPAGLVPACVAAVMAAAPAAAFCPATPEDAQRGILVTYDDGSTMASRLLPDGLQEDIETYNDGTDEAYYTLGKASVFMVEETPVVSGKKLDDETWTFSYPEGIDALPDIVPGLKWEGTVLQSESDGSESTWKMSVSAGAGVTVTHAGCRFEVIPVVSRSVDPDGIVDFLAFEYVPAIGLSLFRGYSEVPEPDDILTIVAFGPYPGE